MAGDSVTSEEPAAEPAAESEAPAPESEEKAEGEEFLIDILHTIFSNALFV